MNERKQEVTERGTRGSVLDGRRYPLGRERLGWEDQRRSSSCQAQKIVLVGRFGPNRPISDAARRTHFLFEVSNSTSHYATITSSNELHPRMCIHKGRGS
jgi:hypothetical protein